MEIATLVCNKKLSYESTFQAYSMYEYLKKQGNQVQIIDYNFLEDRNNKKNQMLYNFLSNNTVLTVNRYGSIEQLEENQPLVDRYIVVNGNYNDLNIKINGNNNIAYGIKDISNSDMSRLEQEYFKISTAFNINNENSKRVIDPIFLLSKEEWYDEINENSKIDKNSEYVLIYSDIVTKDMLKYAYAISQKNNLKIYIVSEKVDAIFFKGKKFNNINPLELADLISNAQEVITSCDDGIKLSVLFDRNLHIFTTQENEQLELIHELNIQNRIVDNPQQCLVSARNYEYSNKVIEELKENSYEFLKL